MPQAGAAVSSLAVNFHSLPVKAAKTTYTNGFKTIHEGDAISVEMENIAPFTLPAEAFSFAPSPDVVQCHFKNGDKERKIYCNIDVSEAEKEQLRKLQQEVKTSKLELLPSIAVMASRFLSRARGDIPKAVKLMKETQEWRQQYFKNGPLSDKELAEDLKHGIIYFSGRDKAYRPVIVVRGKRIPDKWIKEKRTDLLIRVLVFCMEYLIRYMLIPGKVENLNVIFDFKGVSLGISDVSRLKEIYGVMSHHYLGRVFRFYICNLSPGLKMLTSMVVALLTDRQKQKLCFLGEVTELRQDFALHQLEEDLGGNRPVETKFYPFPLPGGPFTAGFAGGSDQESISDGHMLLSSTGYLGRLWDDSLPREENLSLDFEDGAFELFKKFDLPIPPECVKMRQLEAWYNICVAGGTQGGLVFMGTSKASSEVNLWGSDDGSDRQRWVLTKGRGEWYTIQIRGGIEGNSTYLSAHEDGSKVDLLECDDGSGRQQWTLVKGEGDWFNIQIFGGVSGKRTYLSVHEDGSQVDLWDKDDGSGRQRFLICTTAPTEPEEEEIISI